MNPLDDVNNNITMNIPLDHPWAREILRNRPTDYDQPVPMWPGGTMIFGHTACRVRLLHVEELRYGYGMHVDYMTTHWEATPMGPTSGGQWGDLIDGKG